MEYSRRAAPQYSYTWEQSGRLEFARNLDDESLDRWFAYDHVGRLIVSRSGNEARLAIGEQVPLLYNGPYSQGYQYDQWGNITSRDGWGGPNPQYSATYTNNKLDGKGYDQAGNLTDAGGGWTFTYDATGQQATSAIGNVVNVYDGDRLRGKKTEYGATTYYLRSSVLGGQVVAELNQNGNWMRGYVYLGGELLAVQQDASVNWVHQDPLVKSKRITNNSGNVVSAVELDPWGGETTHNSNLNQDFQPRKFANYIRDAIGSDDAMHRRYDRGLTRFQQPDPYNGSYNLSNPQSFNRYTYVNNDPVNFIDPFGLDPGGSLGSGLANLFNGGGLGSGLAGLVNMGPPPSIVTVPIDGDQTDIERRRDLEDLVNPVLSDAKTLLTQDCTRFLNEILAELSKFREPYSRNFIENVIAAQGAIRKVLFSAGARRKGGATSIIGDPSLDITVDERSFGRPDLDAGYTIIHETVHASPATKPIYSHFEMALAAYKVAETHGWLKKLANTNSPDPPRRGSDEPTDWYNSLLFDNVVRFGCPPK